MDSRYKECADKRTDVIGPTHELIRLIGTPFGKTDRTIPSAESLLDIFDKAFKSRVAPLYLSLYASEDWGERLRERLSFVRTRESNTLKVLSDLAKILNEWNRDGYVIFKSIKPYPAIPNDTDVLIFGGKREFESALHFLYDRGYVFHEWAPLQTTVYDPSGKGKIGKGKKGGIYYIDVYREISTDYVRYLNKRAVRPYVVERSIHGVDVCLLRREPELGIILFHNVFPERTYELEHFYMPLYYFADPQFNLELFVRFVEENRLVPAVAANLSLIEELHQTRFGFVPEPILYLLRKWGRKPHEVKRFKTNGLETPHLFSSWTFWASFLTKLLDLNCLSSVVTQFMHMLNPIFFWDVIKSLKKRFSEKGAYHME
jgi:hypothetical protein